MFTWGRIEGDDTKISEEESLLGNRQEMRVIPPKADGCFIFKV